VAEVTDAFGCLQAVAGYPEVSAVVRVSDNDTALIKRHLDQGAQSVMVPNVRSVEEAERAVAAMHYGPRGVRGVAGITRASRFGTVDNYLATASDELCLILQIESRAGLDALEDIAAVDGVDALFIGPADLAANMGHPGNPGAPEVQAAILDAFARLAAIRMPAGILTLDEAFLARCIDAGARVNAVGVDMALLVASLRELRAKY
jgi:4-hydroxy-2-oxoheptanedioate aldolase